MTEQATQSAPQVDRFSYEDYTAAQELEQPKYDATFYEAWSRFFRKYTTFRGRASRAEFWWVIPFLGLAQLILLWVVGRLSRALAMNQFLEPGAALGLFFVSFLVLLLWAAVLVPTLALYWRRFHDSGYPGWLWFLSFIPLGSFVVLVFMLLPPRVQAERYDIG